MQGREGSQTPLLILGKHPNSVVPVSIPFFILGKHTGSSSPDLDPLINKANIQIVVVVVVPTSHMELGEHLSSSNLDLDFPHLSGEHLGSSSSGFYT